MSTYVDLHSIEKLKLKLKKERSAGGNEIFKIKATDKNGYKNEITLFADGDFELDYQL